MGRKTWVKPMTLVQKFEANEPVAASQCYEIACGSNVVYAYDFWDPFKKAGNNAPLGHHWDRNEGFSNGNNSGLMSNLPTDFSHDGTCKDPTKNIFRIDGNSIVFLEEQTGDGALSGGVDWYDIGTDGVLNAGDLVYWHTDKGTIRWNHWGYLQPISNDHPLRS